MSDAIAKVSYTHDALIDCIIANPAISQRQLAEHFGYTEGWISQILQADAVQERIAARKGELLDPILLQSLEKRMQALAQQSMDVLGENLQLHRSSDTALKVLEITSRSLGYGAKSAGVQINQQFVAYMPQKSATGEDWLLEHKPQPAEGRRPPPSVTVDSIIDVPL